MLLLRNERKTNGWQREYVPFPDTPKHPATHRIPSHLFFPTIRTMDAFEPIGHKIVSRQRSES